VVNDAIRQRARDLGFALCGICGAQPSVHGRFFRDWLADGKHGEMAWLARNVRVRIDPGRLLPGARSVIVVADAIPESPIADPPSQVARYACISDYHRVLKKRLFALADSLREQHPDQQFRVCVDTAPIFEREHAARAGLGWIGKHTLILNRDAGSHLLLGEIVTTLPIEPDTPATEHCGTCTRCIDACPTDAITPWSVDARRCISYLTIEHRGVIDAKYFEPMGDWLFGCDICQDVCPFVQRAGAARPGDPPPGYERIGARFDAGAVLDWTEADRRAAFGGSAMKRAKLDMIRRNALIVAGNHLRKAENAALRRRIEAIAADGAEPAMIRQTARDVLARLAGQ
jgi:epoxyqueuosine reductase